MHTRLCSMTCEASSLLKENIGCPQQHCFKILFSLDHFSCKFFSCLSPSPQTKVGFTYILSLTLPPKIFIVPNVFHNKSDK